MNDAKLTTLIFLAALISEESVEAAAVPEPGVTVHAEKLPALAAHLEYRADVVTTPTPENIVQVSTAALALTGYAPTIAQTEIA